MNQLQPCGTEEIKRKVAEGERRVITANLNFVIDSFAKKESIESDSTYCILPIKKKKTDFFVQFYPIKNYGVLYATTTI